MAHFSTLLKIVIDLPPGDHDRELEFWQGALGQALPQFPAPHSVYHGAALHGHDLWLLVQRLDDGAPRVHLDMHTDDLDAEVARLEALGARRVRPVHTWWVMRDPAGLYFCVLPEPPGSLNEDNAQRWELAQRRPVAGSAPWTGVPGLAQAIWGWPSRIAASRRARGVSLMCLP
jgi:hypothetical protein